MPRFGGAARKTWNGLLQGTSQTDSTAHHGASPVLPMGVLRTAAEIGPGRTPGHRSALHDRLPKRGEEVRAAPSPRLRPSLGQAGQERPSPDSGECQLAYFRTRGEICRIRRMGGVRWSQNGRAAGPAVLQGRGRSGPPLAPPDFIKLH